MRTLRKAARLLLILGPVAAAGCTRLFFQPSAKIYGRLDAVGARYEGVRFRSVDGTGLTGVFLPAAPGPAKGTVIQFHGNAENMTTHFLFVYWLVAKGYNVFVFDYRGYGASDGSPSVAGAVQDGIAAIDYVRSRKDVDPSRLVVYGQSLGGALAVASVALGVPNGIRAIVLESTFHSYRSIARRKLARFWLTWPLQWPLSLLFSDRYSPVDYLAKLPACPILVIHGDSDEIVPYREGQELFARARKPKEFWTVPGGRHLEAFGGRFGTENRPRLVEFLDAAVR